MVSIISKKSKTVKKSVSFRVKESTAEQLDALKKRVKSASNDIEFNLDDVIDDQLVKLISKANKQLDSLDTIA